MALPTHPVGTQRLSTIASELEFMKFHAQSQVFRDKIGQLGVEERHRDKVLRPHEVAKPLHTLLRTNVRKTSTKLRTILRPRDVVAGVGKIGKFIEYDYSTRRFVRLTPTNLPLRILFNAYRPKLESRTQPKFEESSEIHGWIMDSIRMSSIAQRPGFRDFYVEPNQIP